MTELTKSMTMRELYR